MKRAACCLAPVGAFLLLLAVPAGARGPRWNGLEAIAVTPDGKTLAVAGHNRTVYVLDAATLSVKRRFWVAGRVGFLAFNRDGRRLLVEDDSESLQFFDTAGWKVLETVPRCSGAVVSATADLVAVRDRSALRNDRLRFLSLSDGKVKGEIELEERASAYAFSPDGKRLVLLTASREGDEEKVPISKAPAELSELERKEFRLKHDGRVSTLRTLEVPSGKAVRQVQLWYTSDSDSTRLVVRGERTWVLNFNNTCARIDAKGKTRLFETGLLFNHGLGTSGDGKLLVCGGMGEGLYGPIEGGKRIAFKIEALPGREEVFAGFAVAADGTAYGVTSAFRVVRIGKDGKVSKVAPVF
jgi:WD40 repeat protein